MVGQVRAALKGYWGLTEWGRKEMHRISGG